MGCQGVGRVYLFERSPTRALTAYQATLLGYC